MQVAIHIAEAANREHPDFAELEKHPRYAQAVKALRAKGLSPRGVRGYPALVELLEEMDAKPHVRITDPGDRASDEYKRDLTKELLKLKGLKKSQEQFEKGIDGHDRDEYERLGIEIEQQMHRITRLRQDIERLRSRKRRSV